MEALTGDSFIVDVRPMYGEIDGFLETFKYALKFSDLELSDTACLQNAERQTPDKQFLVHWEVEVPEELTDEDLDEDLPYMMMVYKYFGGSGYHFTEPEVTAAEAACDRLLRAKFKLNNRR